MVVDTQPPMPLSRVDFTFPDISGLNQQLALRAQSELKDSLEKAQKIYDQVIRQRFKNHAMNWKHTTPSLAPKKRLESSATGPSVGRKATNFRNGKSKQSYFGSNHEGSPDHSQQGNKGMKKKKKKRKRKGRRGTSNVADGRCYVDRRESLSAERKMAIQALHAALSGQEAEMLGQLNARQQNRSNKSMDGQQLDSQQAEVGYSNYARRGAGRVRSQELEKTA